MTTGTYEVIPGTSELEAGDYEAIADKSSSKPLDNTWNPEELFTFERQHNFGASYVITRWSVRWPCSRFTLSRDLKLKTSLNYGLRYLGPPSSAGTITLEQTFNITGIVMPETYIAENGRVQLLNADELPLSYPTFCPAKISYTTLLPGSYKLRFVGRL